MFNQAVVIKDIVKAFTWRFVVQHSEDVDEESLRIIMLCHGSISSYAAQRDIDDAYTKACKWIYSRL